MTFDKNYWENRYLNKETGWDMGQISPPIKQWLDQQENKNLKILIPGAGNAHEVEYAYSLGFNHVYLLDIAPTAINNFQNRNPNFPISNIINEDFFELTDRFDVILEQTFFCALDPKYRKKYVSKCHDLLKANGKLVGLLFDFPLTTEGPPFGGSKEEYKALFSTKFSTLNMNRCLLSIEPRLGKELWIELNKKSTA